MSSTASAFVSESRATLAALSHFPLFAIGVEKRSIERHRENGSSKEDAPARITRSSRHKSVDGKANGGSIGSNHSNSEDESDSDHVSL